MSTSATKAIPVNLAHRLAPDAVGDRHASTIRFMIGQCPSASTYRLFSLASWPRCAARSRRARLAQRGGQPLARSGSSFAASRGCGRTATTFSSTNTRRSPGCQSCVTSVWRSRAHLGGYATETPAGEAAVVVHRGPYDRMNEAQDAIRKWMAANGRESAGHSWEIYGDPTPDPADNETTLVYLLK